MQTKSAYIKAPWNLEFRDIELPDSAPAGWVRLKIEACGLCGTDISAVATKAKDWEPFGHEIAGVVEAVGAGVGNVSVNDRVVVESASSCGVCDVCRDGRNDLCTKAPNFWGQAAMGFSERMMVPAVACVPYEGLSPDVACLAEPSGVGFDMVKVAEIQMGDSVAIVGPGPIALTAVALALRQGAYRVTVIGHSHSKARMELAKRLGAEIRFVDGDVSKESDLARRFNHVLMTAPVQFIAPALSLLAYDGRMTYIGIGSGAGEISFDANDFHFRKLQLRSSFASPARYFPSVLRLLKAGAIPGEEQISHRFAFKDLGEMLRVARDDKQNSIKLVMVNCKK